MKDTPQSRQLCDGVADVLSELAMDAEQLGASLCADPQVTENHAVQLQSIDLFAQTLHQLAEVLASEQPVSAADNVRLEKLRARLIGLTKAPPEIGEDVTFEVPFD